MARALTPDELELLRADGHFTKLYLAILKPNTVYTARLASVPSSTDNVNAISFTSGVGTLSDVKPGMTCYVGTTAGAYDLGMVRIRKDPIAGTFYIGLTSEINWQGMCHLTVVDDFDLWAKHAVLADSALTMDVDVSYSDQHTDFNPVPILGTHAVAKLEGETVDVQFGPPEGEESWVFDSTIDSVLWEIPDAIAIDDDTAIRPIATFDSVGTHVAYCVVHATNGKSTRGVRKAYIWNDDNPPATVFQLAQCTAEYETGGWMFDINMEAEASLSEIRDRELVILFAEDWYGIPPNQVKQSIGPIAGRENIVCVGRIVGQSIRWDRDSGNVHFVVQGAHYWLNKIKGFPIQIQPASAATSWSQLPAMTVDRVLWHLLFWHSTVINTMDVHLTNSTLYVDQGTSMASSIWAQLVDIAFSKLLAQPGVDRFGRLFVDVDPNATPEADRDWPTIMPLDPDDWQEGIDLQRVTVEDCSLIRLTTLLVNSAGSASALYSLSPGHTPRRYGDPEMMDRILAGSQAESNSKAGLILGWRTNEFPDVPVIILQNNRMFDLWPRQFAGLTMAAEDNPRGVGYDGNLIPRRIALYFDSEAQFMHPELNFEGETFEQLSVNGDIPDTNMDDLTLPPIVGLPSLDLPDLPDILPGGFGEPTATGPKTVLFHDTTAGFIVAHNFDLDDPVYTSVNAGLTATQYQNANWMAVCPNGAFYVAYLEDDSPDAFIARAPSVGGTFVVMTLPARPICAAINPLVSEQIGFLTANPGDSAAIFHVGTYSSFSTGASLGGTWVFFVGPRTLSYGLGKWLLTRYDFYALIGADGSSIVASGTPPVIPDHMRASTTGVTYHPKSAADEFIQGTNNLAASATVSSGNGIELLHISSGVQYWSGDCDPTGQYMMAFKAGGNRGKSPDFGTTWADMGSLPLGLYCFAYAGPGESAQRFIAAGPIVRYTDDFGVTWATKENGSLTALNPFPLINMCKVLEF